MKIQFIAGALAIAIISAPALAANPKKFSDGGSTTLANGTTAETSVVTCSNNKEIPLLSIDGKWCVDEAGSYCHSKRMKAAKKACK